MTKCYLCSGSREKRVYICSPYRGDSGWCEAHNILLIDAIRDVALLGHVPVASHAILPPSLDDDDPDERAFGLHLGLAMLRSCDELWVYHCDCCQCPTEGMRGEIAEAERTGIPIARKENP